MDYKLLINFATRNRPDKALACLDNIQQMCEGDCTILLKIDNSDTNDYGFAGKFKNVHILKGDSTGKIDAINRGSLLNLKWDILLNHSDDMWFIRPFDGQIKSDMATYFPDLDGCLHYPDGYANQLWTYSIIGRKYYERDKYIYHPDYVSLWCDNEAQEVAQIRGKFQTIPHQLFEHRHPAWGRTHYDTQYLEQGAYYRHDEQTYLRRKNRNFDL